MITPTTPELLAALVTAHLAENPKEPLMILGLREDLYRKFPASNFSALKEIHDSARKYKWALSHPKKRTAEMAFGSIVHGLTLTPDEVPGMWVKKAYPDFKTKVAQQWRDAQTLIILDDEDLAAMTACSDSIKADPKAAWILERAEKEVAVFRRHDRTGILLKARLDLPFMDLENRLAVADIKKTTSIRRGLFAKAIGDRLMNAQLAFYRNIIGASGGGYIIAVEQAEPNDVRVFKLTDRSLERGEALYEHWLTKLVECTATDRWPTADEDSETVTEIEEPVWAQREAEEIAA